MNRYKNVFSRCPGKERDLHRLCFSPNKFITTFKYASSDTGNENDRVKMCCRQTSTEYLGGNIVGIKYWCSKSGKQL